MKEFTIIVKKLWKINNRKGLTNPKPHDIINYKIKQRKRDNNKIKKITRKERQSLGYYSCVNWVKPFINSYLKETDGGNFILIDEVNLVMYLLLFIPIHLFQILYCIWDGGLKEFEICSRKISTRHLSWDSKSWTRACEILGKEITE